MACAVGKRRRLHVGHVARLEHRHGGVHQRVLRQAPERRKVPGGYHHVPNLGISQSVISVCNGRVRRGAWA